MAKSTIPAAPAHLPKSLQEKWTKTYTDALRTAKADNSELPADLHRRSALREANKLVKVEEPQNLKEAQQMVTDFQEKKPNGWKLIGHGTRQIGGVAHLQIITANGKKHTFNTVTGKPLLPAAPKAEPADDKLDDAA